MKYLFAIVLFSHDAKCDKATPPSFPTCYAPIEASNASLEALMATWYMQWGY